MNTALVCIAKNEDHYIDEWLDYHFKLGFSQIFVYQNDWRYRGKYLEDNRIHLLQCDGTYRQLPAYNHFIKNFFDKFDWAGFIDVDEFIVLKQDKNISSFLKNYNEYNSLGLCWSMFGSNGLTFDGDYSLVRRFTKCKKELDSHIKCFINFNQAKDSLIFSSHTHNINLPNKTISVDKSHFINDYYDKDKKDDRSIAYINHYYTKTKDEWKEKIARGFAWPIALPPNYENIFRDRCDTPDYNEYEDLTAYNFMYKGD